VTRTVEIEQVIAAHRHEWKKWPDTDDKDYSSVFAERFTWTFKRNDVEIRVHNRFYPVYSAYVSSGDLRLPIRFPVIDNLCPPSAAVLDQQRKDLASFSSAGCRSLLWEHTHQCFPDVVNGLLPRLFPLRAISFGDDCPGSSDVKTFPVAANFNAIVYSMFVWNLVDGSLTADEYKRRGIPYTRFCPSSMSVGLDVGLKELGFSIEEKQEKILRGEALPHLAFVGFAGAGERLGLMQQMMSAHSKQKQIGLQMKLHGVGMPDGPLEPRHPPHPKGLGYPMSSLYANSLSGFNIPVSSLFNCRTVDLWMSGNVQFVRDKWSELSKMGFVDGEHFISFDGTANDLLAKVDQVRSTPEQSSRIVKAAYDKAIDFWAKNDWTAAYTDVYFDHLSLF